MSEKKHEMYVAGVKAALEALKEECYVERYDPHYKADPVYTYCIKDYKLEALTQKLLED